MGYLFNELKRRKVVRVAIAYLVVGWIILQVVGEIVDPLNLPDWTETLVIVLLGLGLPGALFLKRVIVELAARKWKKDYVND